MVESQKMNYNYIQGVVNRLKSENKVAYTQLINYVINPYVIGLQYDIYDLNQVDIDFDSGTMKVRVNPNVTMTITLDDNVEYMLDEEEDKIILHFDTSDSSFTLKFKVLNQWSMVEKVNFLDLSKGGQTNPADIKAETDKFIRINRYLMKAKLNEQYKVKGERFFTEVVVDDKLAEGDWNNDFVRQSLANELKNPSEDMVKIIANRLVKDYTTQDVEKVAEQLKPMIKEGLSGIVDYIVSQGLLPTSGYGFTGGFSQPEPKAPAKIEDAPTITEKEKSTLEEEFGDVGISFGKKEDPIETKKVEDTKVEEETTNLEDTLNAESPTMGLSSDGSLSLDDLL